LHTNVLETMFRQHSSILVILTFISVSNLLGQDNLRDNIVNDSLIRVHRIKQVTENWYQDSLKKSPLNTTIEKYNESARKTQKIHINYFYHKFINDYEYNLKKNEIIKTQYCYDWNPYRERRKGDTILEKTVSKYDINTKRNLKTRHSQLEEFRPKETFDNNGRITERIDTTKLGYEIKIYNYDENGKVVERKYYRSHHSNKPFLHAVDSLQYNSIGQLIKETNYYEIKEADDKWEFNREVIKTYSYTKNGLIAEKTELTKYQSLKNRDFIPTVYSYEYEFY
jgi:hypothetical protein